MSLNRSFARRVGKNLSQAAKTILTDDLFSLEYKAALIKKITQNKKVYLEIGLGDGAHLIHQAELNRKALFVGVEVYLNGVAKTIIEAKQKALDNILLWPNDLDFILQELPNQSLDGIYILFPDPWPKRKQQKKRLFNQIRFNILKSKLKIGAFINFASDVNSYLMAARAIILKDQDFKIFNVDFSIPHPNYIHTKYHQKAIMEAREAQFLQAVYKN